ncbi:hypothetical protein JCGZ_12483 [Jatropha curcas]|uniref:MADS-box domain-containing protein n=1 Tax=Jatropha curcas TaxID=180498 RepID=A0A067K7C6_JATCU|nr:hypothetical protein JCGZ_12483 [Jatropha curcas]
MGRSKIILKKIENPTYRHITFAKRKSGIIKKAYELSTLCDIEIALIVFSPAGKLFLYEGKKRLEEIIDHYFDLPDNQRQRYENYNSITSDLQPFYPMNINSDGFMMGSSSYNPVDRPLQFDFDVPGFSEFPLFSNQEQNFPELQPPLAFLDGYGFPLNYVQNNDNNFNACVPYSHQMGQFPNMNLPSTSTSTSTINTNEQGSASNAPVQGQEGDPATGFYNPGYGNYPFRF